MMQVLPMLQMLQIMQVLRVLQMIKECYRWSFDNTLLIPHSALSPRRRSRICHLKQALQGDFCLFKSSKNSSYKNFCQNTSCHVLFQAFPWQPFSWIRIPAHPSPEDESCRHWNGFSPVKSFCHLCSLTRNLPKQLNFFWDNILFPHFRWQSRQRGALTFWQQGEWTQKMFWGRWDSYLQSETIWANLS